MQLFDFIDFFLPYIKDSRAFLKQSSQIGIIPDKTAFPGFR